MSNIFDGLEKFGLSNFSQVNLFATEKIKKPTPPTPQIKVFNIKDYVYSKEFQCPVCGKTFGSNIIRTGKIKLVNIEYDLRPIYEPIEPIFYDVVVCVKCGYGALKQQFLNISDRQIEWVQEQLCSNYTPVSYPDELDIDMSIERYKLVLLNAFIKKAKDGEKAYICMKLSWLYHLKNDIQNELLFVKQAHEGFLKAFINETPPIIGLEENTLLYLIGVFSKKLSMFEEATRFLSKVITSRTASDRLKDRARSLKNMIIEEKQARQPN